MDANPNVKDHAGRPVFLMPWSLFEMNPKLRSEVIRKEGEYVLEMSLLLLAHSKSCGNKPTLRQGLTNINYNIYHLLHATTDVNINCQRFDGNTALHLATRYNIVNLVIALIRFGADPYITKC